jgi:uncharacterized phage-associated protein
MPQSGTNKPLPRLKPSHKKILEAILFLINEAERRKIYVTEYDIDKAVFVADVKHLNQYGRPITFDNYVAMEHGPVPSTVRTLLSPQFRSKQWYTEAWPPWERVPSPSDGQKAFKFIRPKRQENTRVLSATDVGALSEALSVVKSLRFGGTRDYTHKHAAYVDAWQKRGTKNASDMDYGKLLDTPDPELIEDLVYSSKHM